MAKYYFTYEGDIVGSTQGKPRRQPFKGGWTEVVIDSNEWIDAWYGFAAVHPELFDNKKWCGYDFLFDEEQFAREGFAERGINGYKCVERITMNVEVLERGAMNV